MLMLAVLLLWKTGICVDEICDYWLLKWGGFDERDFWVEAVDYDYPYLSTLMLCSIFLIPESPYIYNTLSTLLFEINLTKFYWVQPVKVGTTHFFYDFFTIS
jgi:hypothetical protein